MCSLEAIEDEDHFLLVCPAYEHVRNTFREQLPLGPVMPVQELLSCQDQSSLARFLEQCLQYRNFRILSA